MNDPQRQVYFTTGVHMWNALVAFVDQFREADWVPMFALEELPSHEGGLSWVASVTSAADNQVESELATMK